MDETLVVRCGAQPCNSPQKHLVIVVDRESVYGKLSITCITSTDHWLSHQSFSRGARAGRAHGSSGRHFTEGNGARQRSHRRRYPNPSAASVHACSRRQHVVPKQPTRSRGSWFQPMPVLSTNTIPASPARRCGACHRGTGAGAAAATAPPAPTACPAQDPRSRSASSRTPSGAPTSAAPR